MRSRMTWMLLLLVFLGFSFASSRGLKKSYITSECYGSVLSLSCKPGHRIKVLDDFFGVSERIRGSTMCRFEPGDCTVTNSRFTSVIHRYCEGKQTCTTFQVDRRFCGNNQTNYEQVEYACVPDYEITDICSTTMYTTNAGYISTPNFPHEYPTNMDCSCTLRVNQAQAKIKLEATHFIVKFDNPCRDWLEIDVYGKKRRLCGAYRSTLRSADFNLTFHSDDKDGHQGVWLYFAVDPLTPNITMTVECGHDASTATTTPVPSTTSSTTEEPILMNNNSKVIDDTRNETLKDPPQQNTKSNMADNNSTGRSRTIDIIDETGHVHELTTLKRAKPTVPPKNMSDFDDYPDDILLSGSKRDDDQQVVRIKKDERINSFNDGQHQEDASDELIRQRNRTTGIIIISICVGGIILLVAILGILLCLNKKRHPKRVAERERKKRLQQRLNSLSFYDSIPLYDSMGRKGGGQLSHMLRLPPPPPPPPGTENQPSTSQPNEEGAANNNKVTNTNPNNNTPQTLDPKKLPYKAWSPSTDVGESEVDSTLYAELDKHWHPGAATSDDATASGDVASTCTKESNTPNGEGPPGYSLHLKPPDATSEDIYTHV